MTYTVLEKWAIIADPLAKAGLDLSKISPLQRAMLVGQAESDEIIGSDEDVWKEWAESLVTVHPTWAGEGFWRLKHARELIDGWHSGVFQDPSSNPIAEDLAQNKYAVISWYDGSTNVYGCYGDTIKDVLEVIMGLQYESETDEWVESYVDLDTGEHHSLLNKLTTVITLTLGDVEYTNAKE